LRSSIIRFRRAQVYLRVLGILHELRRSPARVVLHLLQPHLQRRQLVLERLDRVCLPLIQRLKRRLLLRQPRECLAAHRPELPLQLGHLLPQGALDRRHHLRVGRSKRRVEPGHLPHQLRRQLRHHDILVGLSALLPPLHALFDAIQARLEAGLARLIGRYILFSGIKYGLVGGI